MQSNQKKRRYKSVALRTRNAPSVDEIVEVLPDASARSDWIVGGWCNRYIMRSIDTGVDRQGVAADPTRQNEIRGVNRARYRYQTVRKDGRVDSVRCTGTKGGARDIGARLELESVIVGVQSVVRRRLAGGSSGFRIGQFGFGLVNGSQAPDPPTPLFRVEREFGGWGWLRGNMKQKTL